MIKKLISRMINKEVLKIHIQTRAEVLALQEIVFKNNLSTGNQMNELVKKYRDELTEIIERTKKYGK